MPTLSSRRADVVVLLDTEQVGLPSSVSAHGVYRPLSSIENTFMSRKAFDASVQTRYKSDLLLFLFKGRFSPLDAAPQRDAEVTVGPTVGIVVKYLDTHVYIWLCSVG